MTLALAPEPGRSTGSVTISFGLLSIPVSLYSQHQVTRTARHEYVADGSGGWHSVGRQAYDKETGVAVERADVVKMVDVGGTLVEVDDAAYAAATGAADLAGRLDIEATVPLDDLWSLFGGDGSVWQVRAQKNKKAGAAAAGDRGLALLLAALDRAGVAAVGRTALRGGEVRLVALTPDGSLHALRTVDQQRAQKPLPEVALTEAEVELATTLIESIGTLDTEAEWLNDLGATEVASRAAAVAAAGGVATVTVLDDAPVLDPDALLATLKASVEKVQTDRKDKESAA
jgi:DNA end-binding protein Ku